MITCIIIEDAKLARESLCRLIEANFSSDLCIVGIGETLSEGIELINSKKPDLVFLDIELPDENGLHLFEYFEQMTFEVIFTTSNENYAVNAIKYSAIDYLLKPIGIMDMRAALIRYQKQDQREPSSQKVKEMLETMKMGKPFGEKIALPTDDGFQVIRVDEILYCLSMDNQTNVYTIHNENFQVNHSLKALEELLPVDSFFRIHKTILLNLNYVKSFSKKDGGIVTLENGQRFDVDSQKQDEFSNVFLKRPRIIPNLGKGDLSSN